jgi:molybdate transport system permease protein
MLSESDLSAALLTVRLAGTTTVFLLLLGTPLAYWLTFSKSWLKRPVSALVSLPLVLPPTVLGFYLLILMGPRGMLGKLIESLGWPQLSFSFSGLVIGSILYSLPFVVQPIQQAFKMLGTVPLETAATLGASAQHRFFNVILPLTKNAFLTATILGFAHTVGEFGLVLMLGGNIPGKTRVLSMAIYDHVEAMDYEQANSLSLYLLMFSFLVLLALQLLQTKEERK